MTRLGGRQRDCHVLDMTRTTTLCISEKTFLCFLSFKFFNIFNMFGDICKYIRISWSLLHCVLTIHKFKFSTPRAKEEGPPAVYMQVATIAYPQSNVLALTWTSKLLEHCIAEDILQGVLVVRMHETKDVLARHVLDK